MLEEIGVVSNIDNQAGSQIVWIDTQVKSTCGSCEAQSNCGTGAIAKVFANKRESIKFQYDGNVTIGQKVKLGIAEESVLQASILVYILPLFALIFSAIIAENILPKLGLSGEIWVIIAAFSVAATTYKLIHIYMNKQSCDKYQPKILTVLPLESQNISFKQV